MNLVKKGATAQLGAFNQLKIQLKWTSAVDLDLMAFYKTKSGKVGGVYSENYSSGSLGDLNMFPFMQLSEDAGVGAVGGDNQEEMRIVKLDDIDELYICALNFTDAIVGNNNNFLRYDAKVVVATDNGEQHSISLDSNAQGTVAIICKFKSGFLGTELLNDSSVIDFNTFKSTIPGASALQLASKVTLDTPGQSMILQKKGDTKDFLATLKWRSAVDLDLHCFYRLKGTQSNGGFFQKIMTSVGQEGHIFYGGKGSLNRSPWIRLDKDSGVGDVGGDNEENMTFTNLDGLDCAIVVANIYSKNTNFSQYDGRLTVKGGGREIDVPLTEKQRGSWCVVALIDNRDETPKLININKTISSRPKLNDYLKN